MYIEIADEIFPSYKRSIFLSGYLLQMVVKREKKKRKKKRKESNRVRLRYVDVGDQSTKLVTRVSTLCMSR